MKNNDYEYCYHNVSEWEIQYKTTQGQTKSFNLNKIITEDINFNDGELSVFIKNATSVPELGNHVLYGDKNFVVHQFTEAFSITDNSKIIVHNIYTNIKDVSYKEHSDCSSSATFSLSFKTHQKRQTFFE